MSMPPPIGIPGGPPLQFDTVSIIWGLTALIMLAGLAAILWALRNGSRNDSPRHP